MRRLYTFFLYLLVPFILMRLYWKGRRNPAYRERIAERFSLGKNLPGKVDIWLHAVSLGEVVAATPLIESLLQKQKRILITTMTPTGSQQVKTRFGARVEHQYLPYDLPCCLRRFYQRTQPQMGIIMETELWPNMIHSAKLAKISLALVNARISDKAFKQYQKIKWLLKPLFAHFTLIGTQSELDATRYLQLGAPAEIVQMLGNMKFDIQIPDSLRDKFFTFKQSWGDERPVFIAASTHEDEENQLLSRLKQLQASMAGVVLLIAPRRPERFQDVYELSQRHGFLTARRSQPETITFESEVVVLDSMGELLGFYELSDYAFVGGSLVSIGGHNVLEPIALQVPVFCGPFMQNSKSICNELKAADAIQLTQGADDLFDVLINLYRNPEQRARQIANATAVLKANRGAVERYVNALWP